MVLVLFGLPGVGKSFVSRILANRYNFISYEADDDLTPEMIEAIRLEQVFTTAMRHHFFNIVINKLRYLQRNHPRIVMTQAIAKEQNRIQVLEGISAAKFIHVQANMNNIKNRLKLRNDWVSEEYAEKIRQIFEIPKIFHQQIDNNADINHVDEQIDKLLKQIYLKINHRDMIPA